MFQTYMISVVSKATKQVDTAFVWADCATQAQRAVDRAYASTHVISGRYTTRPDRLAIGITCESVCK